MKLEAVVLFDDMSTLRFKLKRPTDMFELKYAINNAKQTFPYKFVKEKMFLDKHLLFFNKKCIYYKHGHPEPLSLDFKLESYNVEELNAYLDTKLFSKISDSTKDNKMAYSIGMILGLAGIAVIGLIAIFG